jgi:stage V sporulation protein G
MEITEVRVTLRNEEKLKAFANITFDGAFVIRGLKVIKGAGGFFISMPSRKRPDGSHQDIAHPINIDMRKSIEDAVLAEYNRTVSNSSEKSLASGADSQ